MFWQFRVRSKARMLLGNIDPVGAVCPPVPQCEDLEEFERCASKLTVLGELSPNCHLKPAEASKCDIFDIRGISPAFYFVEVPERERRMHNRLMKLRLTVSPAPSSGCEMIVPVALQTARGSGHKGARRLRTGRIGPWQRAVEFGEMGSVRRASPNGRHVTFPSARAVRLTSELSSFV